VGEGLKEGVDESVEGTVREPDADDRCVANAAWPIRTLPLMNRNAAASESTAIPRITRAGVNFLRRSTIEKSGQRVWDVTAPVNRARRED